MGTKFAPSYVCILMDRVETSFLASEQTQRWVWLRYIDDIFMVWSEGEEKLDSFIERVNGFHPSLKFTEPGKASRSSVDFLDVTVRLESGGFSTELYCKPTNKHQYLHYESSHPNHIKKPIVYSQGLRIKRLCSTESSYEKHLASCYTWFLNRGYPKTLVQKQFEKVRRIKMFEKERVNKSRCIPLIVT